MKATMLVTTPRIPHNPTNRCGYIAMKVGTPHSGSGTEGIHQRFHKRGYVMHTLSGAAMNRVPRGHVQLCRTAMSYA